MNRHRHQRDRLLLYLFKERMRLSKCVSTWKDREKAPRALLRLCALADCLRMWCCMRQRDRTSLCEEVWRAVQIQYSSLSVLARSTASEWVSQNILQCLPLPFHAKTSFLLDCHLSVFCIHLSIRQEKPKDHSPPPFLPPPPTLSVISCTSIILYLLHSALELHCGTQALRM